MHARPCPLVRACTNTHAPEHSHHWVGALTCKRSFMCAISVRAGAEPQAEHVASVGWKDLDLVVLLRCFCAKQQRHYLVRNVSVLAAGP